MALLQALGGSAEDAAKGELLYPQARSQLKPPERRREGSGSNVTEVEQPLVGEDGSIPLNRMPEHSVDAMDAIVSRYPKVTYAVPSGFSDLDIITGGLRFGQLIIIAGPPSAGKSTLSLNFARACVRNGDAFLYLSLEADRTQAAMKVIAAECKLRSLEMRAGLMDDDNWTRMARRMTEIADDPLYINDLAPASVGDLEQSIRDAHSECQIRLFILDYAELVAESSSVPTDGDVVRLMRRLKLLACDLNIAVVVVVAQVGPVLPKASWSRRPELSDIHAVGMIQHSDVILLLHRPDLIDFGDERAGEVDTIVAKNRNGPTSIVTVAHQLHYCRFVELVSDPPPA